MAVCASAGASVDEARQIVDRAQPLRCEVLALEAGVKAAPAGSGEAAALGARLDEAKALLKYHYLATMDEYIAVMKQLPFEERQAVYRYDHAVAGRCPPR